MAYFTVEDISSAKGVFCDHTCRKFKEFSLLDIFETFEHGLKIRLPNTESLAIDILINKEEYDFISSISEDESEKIKQYNYQNDKYGHFPNNEMYHDYLLEDYWPLTHRIRDFKIDFKYTGDTFVKPPSLIIHLLRKAKARTFVLIKHTKSFEKSYNQINSRIIQIDDYTMIIGDDSNVNVTDRARSDEGFYDNCYGVYENSSKNYKGLIFAGQQNVSVIGYGMADERNIRIPDKIEGHSY